VNISAADLKALLKKISVVRTDMVVLDLEKGTLYAHSDDLRILVSHPALVAGVSGVIQFNGRKLASAISRLSGILTLTPSKTGLKVVAAKTNFELEAAPVKGYNAAMLKSKKQYTLVLADLKQLLKAAVVVTQKGAAEYANIVQLQGGPVMVARATNNLRMVTFFGNVYEGEPFAQTVPVAAVSAIQELSGDTVLMGVTDATLDFIETSGDTKVHVSARLQDKQLPNFAAITPKAFTSSLKVDAATLREGLRRISPFIPADDQKRVDVSFPGDEIKLSAVSGGTATDLVPLHEPTALPEADEDPFAEPQARAEKLIVNHAYLSDFFDAADGVVTIGMNGGKNPVFLESTHMQALISQMEEV
jgi:DNA polymerase III sliding clamp (beta) subunit (PCNA family)